AHVKINELRKLLKPWDKKISDKPDTHCRIKHVFKVPLEEIERFLPKRSPDLTINQGKKLNYLESGTNTDIRGLRTTLLPLPELEDLQTNKQTDPLREIKSSGLEKVDENNLSVNVQLVENHGTNFDIRSNN